MNKDTDYAKDDINISISTEMEDKKMKILDTKKKIYTQTLVLDWTIKKMKKTGYEKKRYKDKHYYQNGM